MNSHTADQRTDYYARRERQEREIADRAASDVARQIHLALATRYAELARG